MKTALALTVFFWEWEMGLTDTVSKEIVYLFERIPNAEIKARTFRNVYRSDLD